MTETIVSLHQPDASVPKRTTVFAAIVLLLLVMQGTDADPVVVVYRPTNHVSPRFPDGAPVMGSAVTTTPIVVDIPGPQLRSSNFDDRRLQLLLHSASIAPPTTHNTTRDGDWMPRSCFTLHLQTPEGVPLQPLPDSASTYDFVTTSGVRAAPDAPHQFPAGGAMNPHVELSNPPLHLAPIYSQMVTVPFPQLDESSGGMYPGSLAGPLSADVIVLLRLNASCLTPSSATVLPSTEITVRFSPPGTRRVLPRASADAIGSAALVANVAASFVHGMPTAAVLPVLHAGAVLEAAVCSLRSNRNDAFELYATTGASFIPHGLLSFANQQIGGGGSGVDAVIGAALGGFILVACLGTLAALGVRLQACREGWVGANATALLRFPGVVLPLLIPASATALQCVGVVFQFDAGNAAAVAGVSLAAVSLVIALSAIVVVAAVGSVGLATRWYWHGGVSDATGQGAVLRRAVVGTSRRGMDHNPSVPLLEVPIAKSGENGSLVATASRAHRPRGVTFDEVNDVLDPHASTSSAPAPMVIDIDPPPSSSAGVVEPSTATDDGTSHLGRHPDHSGAGDDVVERDPLADFFTGEGFWADGVFDFVGAADVARQTVLTSAFKPQYSSRESDADSAAACAIPEGASSWRCGFTARFGHALHGYRRFGGYLHAVAITVDPVFAVLPGVLVFGWRPPVAACRGLFSYVLLAVIVLRCTLAVAARPYRTSHVNVWSGILSGLNLLATVFATVHWNAALYAETERPSQYWAQAAAEGLCLVSLSLSIVQALAVAVADRADAARQRPVTKAVAVSNRRYYDARWYASERKRHQLSIEDAESRREREARYELRRAQRLADEREAARREAAHRLLMSQLDSPDVVSARARNPLDAADRELDVTGRRRDAVPFGLEELGQQAADGGRRPRQVSFGGVGENSSARPGVDLRRLFEDQDAEDAAVLAADVPVSRDGRYDEASWRLRSRMDEDSTLASWGLTSPPTTTAVEDPPTAPVGAEASRAMELALVAKKMAAAAPPPQPSSSLLSLSAGQARPLLDAFDADFDAAVKAESQAFDA